MQRFVVCIFAICGAAVCVGASPSPVSSAEVQSLRQEVADVRQHVKTLASLVDVLSSRVIAMEKANSGSIFGSLMRWVIYLLAAIFVTMVIWSTFFSHSFGYDRRQQAQQLQSVLFLCVAVVLWQWM